jgi:hypothetical protein
VIDVLASEGHFADHLAPVWAALPDALRGRFLAGRDLETALEHGDDQLADAVLVASYGDHKRARQLAYARIARMEHGAGQSYGGDPRTADIPNYAGGRDADDVGLFLVPGPHPASRWATAYPDATVVTVGSPRLDALPAREPDGRTVVAISFHYTAYLGCPEGDSAFRWYRNLLAELTRRFTVIGHAHPRHAQRLRPWFSRAGIPFVADFADVCRRADVYACDNSSTIFEFAATGRPVVVLDGPHFRHDVEHGLRFWDASHVGQRATPATLRDALKRALEGEGDRREEALARVYAHRQGGAHRAAAEIHHWHEAA